MRDDIEKRLARIESRLVQLMLHMGIDPNERKYESKFTYHGKQETNWGNPLRVEESPTLGRHASMDEPRTVRRFFAWKRN
jgi:hypothetical protein